LLIEFEFVLIFKNNTFHFIQLSYNLIFLITDLGDEFIHFVHSRFTLLYLLFAIALFVLQKGIILK